MYLNSLHTIVTREYSPYISKNLHLRQCFGEVGIGKRENIDCYIIGSHDNDSESGFDRENGFVLRIHTADC